MYGQRTVTEAVELNCIMFLKTDYAHHNQILNSSFYSFFSLVTWDCSLCKDFGENWIIYILRDYIFAVPITISLENNATLHSFR